MWRIQNFKDQDQIDLFDMIFMIDASIYISILTFTN